LREIRLGKWQAAGFWELWMVSNRIVAVIPARAGSKGIRGKNLIDFGGKPLLAATVEVACASGVIDRVIVSTESEAIAAVARASGAEAPFPRPPELARDDVHAVHVVLHVLDRLAADENYDATGVMMLLPTSPLRRPDDVRGVVRLFEDRGADAVISVVDLGKYLTNLRYMDGERLEIVAPGEIRNAQRQGLEKLYGVNGSIFLAQPGALRAQGTFHIDGALGYVMPACNSIDINSPEDLAWARRIRNSSAYCSNAEVDGP
jgi:CMP-N,N'-diacetyllegionaminic acid synthase